MGTSVVIDILGTEYASSPESYFLAQGKQIPPFKTKTDIYRSVWRDFEAEAIKFYNNNKNRGKERKAGALKFIYDLMKKTLIFM